MQTKLGHRIKELRIQRGYSQERFAELIGMDRSYYTTIESGKRNATIKKLADIADGFGITLSELFEGI